MHNNYNTKVEVDTLNYSQLLAERKRWVMKVTYILPSKMRTAMTRSDSGARFHCIRNASSHTRVIMALNAADAPSVTTVAVKVEITVERGDEDDPVSDANTSLSGVKKGKDIVKNG
eukprot:m.3436 g.3436  ORF g.3436 m.3436 type:complete len:116 (+) comp3475_c0_seq1:94-441(+)